MSAHSPSTDSIYTYQVKQLINMVYPQNAGYGSIFEDARHYFIQNPQHEKRISALQAQLAKAKKLIQVAMSNLRIN